MLRKLALALAITLATQASAVAHAFLSHASPAVGSTVATSPDQVVLEFTENIEPSLSSASVTDAQGAVVSTGVAAAAPGRKDALAVPLRPLAPGTYKVIWRVVSVDTHVTQGNFQFTIKASP